VTVDFARWLKNLIQVSLSGQNYRRRALLEGSNESKGWEVVAEDLWLFDVSMEDQNFKVDTLKFPANNFRYLRLTVYNMTDDPRRITIETVKGAFQRIEQEKELLPVPVKQMTISHNEDKNQTNIEVDLGFRHLPVVSLQFEIATPYFYRGYELHGRNEIKEKVPRKTETGSDIAEREVPWSLCTEACSTGFNTRQNDESLGAEDLMLPPLSEARVLNGIIRHSRSTESRVSTRDPSGVSGPSGKRHMLLGET
jgi:hypothetical protein